MATKTKAFDCVQMKRRAQSRLLAEYEQRKDEFASYAEFITSKARQVSCLPKPSKTRKNTTHRKGA